MCVLYTHFACLKLKENSTFFGNRLILPLPQSKTVEFYHFQIHSADFLIFRRISVTRLFLVPLTSIVGKKIYTMEVNETRNCLVTDILLNIRKSPETILKR